MVKKLPAEINYILWISFTEHLFIYDGQICIITFNNDNEYYY